MELETLKKYFQSKMIAFVGKDTTRIFELNWKQCVTNVQIGRCFRNCSLKYLLSLLWNTGFKIETEFILDVLTRKYGTWSDSITLFDCIRPLETSLFNYLDGVPFLSGIIELAVRRNMPLISFDRIKINDSLIRSISEFENKILNWIGSVRFSCGSWRLMRDDFVQNTNDIAIVIAYYACHSIEFDYGSYETQILLDSILCKSDFEQVFQRIIAYIKIFASKNNFDLTSFEATIRRHQAYQIPLFTTRKEVVYHEIMRPPSYAFK